MSTVLLATNVLEQIQQHGAPLTDDIKIVPDNAQIGQYVPQGDINLIRLSDLPSGVVSRQPDRQLAPGSTRGSRHCIRESDIQHVDFFGFTDANPLEGPILVFGERTVIEHPEHKHISFPAGIWTVTYQRRHAAEMRRISD